MTTGKKRANGEGSLRKRPDGRWEGRYTAGCDPVTGKAIYKNVLAKTQKECKEKLAQAIEKNGKIDVTKAGQYTVEEWCWLWHENYCKPAVKDSTAEYYRSYGAAHPVQPGYRLPPAAQGEKGDEDPSGGANRRLPQCGGGARRPAHVLPGADHRAEEG